MANMRAYEDGNRLIIVLENPETSLIQLVKSLLTNQVTCIEHLGEPPAMAPPALSFSELPEITPVQSDTRSPKFVQKFINGQKAPTTGEKQQVPDTHKPEEGKAIHLMDIRIMSIFELRNFILQRSSQLRMGTLSKEFHTDNLEFVLYAKSESVLRKLALQLAG